VAASDAAAAAAAGLMLLECVCYLLAELGLCESLMHML
jgi:hypothetical protein